MQISSIGSSSGTDSASIAKMMAEMRKNMIAKLDKNGDGKLDATELADVTDKTGMKVDDLLNQFDEDNDGVLSKTEANKMFEAMKPKGPPPDQQTSNLDETDSSKELKTLLDALDESDDKKTTEDLFAQYLQNLVQKYNVNNSYNNDGTYNTNGATNSQLLDIQA